MPDSDAPVLVHMHLSDSSPVAEEEMELADGTKANVLWKDVLVEGEYPMSPTGPGGAASDQPMKVVASGTSSMAEKTISMSDVIAAHEDQAHKYVTIPTSHKDGLLENTGYVVRPKGVRVVNKYVADAGENRNVMQAALGFTEPDVKGKVKRGTIADVSGGFFFGFTNKHTKKKYACSMKHVALTPTPFMGNLDPFPAVFASDEDFSDKTVVEVYNFDDAVTSTSEDIPASEDSSASNEIIWDAKRATEYITSQIRNELNKTIDGSPSDAPYVAKANYYVQDIAPDDKTALVKEYYKGEETQFVIPYSIDADNKVTVSPSIRWVEAQEVMVAASDDQEKDFEEMSLSSLQKQLGVMLADMTQGSPFVYRVNDVTVDNRFRVVNNAQGKEWIAHFAQLPSGGLWIQPSDSWEVVEKQEQQQLSDVQVALSDDPMYKAVQIARANRGIKPSNTTTR